MASVFAKLKGLNKKNRVMDLGKDVGSFCLLLLDTPTEKSMKKTR